MKAKERIARALERSANADERIAVALERLAQTGEDTYAINIKLLEQQGML